MTLILVSAPLFILLLGKAQRKKELKKACPSFQGGDSYSDATPNSRTRQKDRRIVTLPWLRRIQLVRIPISHLARYLIELSQKSRKRSSSWRRRKRLQPPSRLALKSSKQTSRRRIRRRKNGWKNTLNIGSLFSRRSGVLRTMNQDRSNPRARPAGTFSKRMVYHATQNAVSTMTLS